MADLTTEQKIKNAAREVFMKKGYSATRTRDIAEAANTNLALVNYHFKSKENLFRIIVEDIFNQFLGSLIPFLANTEISLDRKVEILVEEYTEVMIKNPDFPFFVINEMRNNKEILKNTLEEARNISIPVIKKQLEERNIQMSVGNFIVNIISLTLFPFVAQTLMESSKLIEKERFPEFIEERKKLIPIWIKKLSEI